MASANERKRALASLFSARRLVLLQALFRNPERWWTVGELAAHLGLAPAVIRRAAAPLIRGGVLREREARDGPRFHPDPACPIFSQLCKMLDQFPAMADPTPAPGHETILLVEDEPATLRIVRILLESWGYRVLEARCGEDAVPLFEQYRDSIRLLLTDMVMPGMSGARLAESLRRKEPSLRVVFMSGYHTEEIQREETAFLPKPFNPDNLARIIRAELERG